MSELMKDLEKKRDLGHAGIQREEQLQGHTEESST